ncbi:hypothetical protein BpHYR1_029528 [Brachionus plicatilis]|uniref:Uncharacterized protein n=1 Tax=Brachionus plicatilis TaxID=10195 RepID=A0A3M7P0Q7_BRAPC|nr:hypothetical protein BpHYR1_029528 [Brachionus plicatilis]
MIHILLCIFIHYVIRYSNFAINLKILYLSLFFSEFFGLYHLLRSLLATQTMRNNWIFLCFFSNIIFKNLVSFMTNRIEIISSVLFVLFDNYYLFGLKTQIKISFFVVKTIIIVYAFRVVTIGKLLDYMAFSKTKGPNEHFMTIESQWAPRFIIEMNRIKSLDMTMTVSHVLLLVFV